MVQTRYFSRNEKRVQDHTLRFVVVDATGRSHALDRPAESALSACSVDAARSERDVWYEVDGRPYANGECALVDCGVRQGSTVRVRPRVRGGGRTGRATRSRAGIVCFTCFSIAIYLTIMAVSIKTQWFEAPFATYGSIYMKIGGQTERAIKCKEEIARISWFLSQELAKDCKKYANAGASCFAFAIISFLLFLISVLMEILGRSSKEVLVAFTSFSAVSVLGSGAAYAAVGYTTFTDYGDNKLRPGLGVFMAAGVFHLVAAIASCMLSIRPLESRMYPRLRTRWPLTALGAAAGAMLVLGMVFNAASLADSAKWTANSSLKLDEMDSVDTLHFLAAYAMITTSAVLIVVFAAFAAVKELNASLFRIVAFFPFFLNFCALVAFGGREYQQDGVLSEYSGYILAMVATIFNLFGMILCWVIPADSAMSQEEDDEQQRENQVAVRSSSTSTEMIAGTGFRAAMGTRGKVAHDAPPVDPTVLAQLLLEKDEELLHWCKTRESRPSLGVGSHVFLTLVSLGTWPLLYSVLISGWPNILIYVVVTNKRLLYWRDCEGSGESSPSNRTLQQFHLSSVATVQQTYSSTPSGCCDQRSVAHIRIWLNRYPTYIPPAEKLGKLFNAKPVGMQIAKVGAKVAMGGGPSDGDLAKLAKKVIAMFIFIIYAYQAMKKLAKSIFIGNRSYIEFQWDERDKDKLQQSDKFVSVLCSELADIHRGADVHVNSSSDAPPMASVHEFVANKRAQFLTDMYGLGPNERVLCGIATKPAVTASDIVMSIFTCGLYYCTNIRKRKGKACTIMTTHRLIEVAFDGKCKGDLYGQSRKKFALDVRHFFFDSNAMITGRENAITDSCAPRAHKTFLLQTRFGVLMHAEGGRDSEQWGTLEPGFEALLRYAPQSSVLDASEVEPVKVWDKLRPYLEEGEVHAGSVSGKSPGGCCTGELGEGQSFLCFRDKRRRASILLTDKRLFFITEDRSQIGYSLTEQFIVAPIAFLSDFVYTEVDDVSGCCGVSRRVHDGFGPSGLQLHTPMGPLHVPSARNESSAERLRNFLQQMSHASYVANEKNSSSAEKSTPSLEAYDV